MTPRQIIDETLRLSKKGTLAQMQETGWLDCQPPFEQSHFVKGFGWPDGKYRFKPDWANVPAGRRYDLRHRANDSAPARPLGRQREG